MATSPRQYRSWAAVIVLGVGVVLGMVLGMLLGVGFWQTSLAHEIGSPAPASLPIQFDIRQISEKDAGYLVRLRVRNAGPDRIANLHIEGQLYAGQTRLERSVGQLELMPPGTVRQVSLFFVNDPRRHQVRFLARGDDVQPVATRLAADAPAVGVLSLL